MARTGIVSPGGVGYDINCGVRLLRTNLALADIQPVLTLLVNQMLHDIPVGVGQGGSHVFSPAELRTLMREGVPFLRARGLATDDDVACTEAEGCIPDARPDFVSDRALARGGDQCGTVGAGNHFIEVQIVDRIEDAATAAAFGLHAGQICVSRSLERSFGTTCHGAGRALSHTAATKAARGRNIQDELQRSGVVARCRSREGLAEEQPAASKDVDIVVDIVHRAGLSLKVARLRPLGVIKG